MTDWATYASRRRYQSSSRTENEHSDSDDELHDEESFEEVESPGARRTAGDRVLGLFAWMISMAQYLLPAVLAPIGGLTGLAYADVPGALAGALVGLLLALLLMPVARWAGWLGVRLVAGVLGGARRHLFVFALLALGLALLVMEFRT